MTSTRLPQVDRILRHPSLVEIQNDFRREFIADLVRQELASIRNRQSGEDPDADAIATSVRSRIDALLRPSLSKLINGTGVVLNTNLGRSPVSAHALQQATRVATGYCNLEIDLTTGKRGKRSARIDALLRLITGAEAGMVVNNNAAAVLLAVNALAKDKEVVVSRGELIEIGGSFRLPDVIESAGGILREVGTTNRTRVGDFKKVAGPNTGLYVRCHRSNFSIEGFTEEVTLAELVALSAETGVPVLEDLGSGVLFDLGSVGLKEEPTVREVVSSGCDLVCFSGDKLLGGPQAGIIVGKKHMVEKLSKHPLYRALRLDKIALALLENTLLSYLSPTPEKTLPMLAMIMTPIDQIKERAQKFADTIRDANGITCRVVETNATAGGGSLPGESMHSYGVTLEVKGLRPVKIAELLRQAEPPVISIVQNDQVILDFRTIQPEEEEWLKQAILSLPPT